MQLTKDEQIQAFTFLVEEVGESPELQSYIKNMIWNISENVEEGKYNIFNHRYGDI